MSFRRRFKKHYSFLKRRTYSYIIDHTLILFINLFVTYAYLDFFTNEFFTHFAISIDGLEKTHHINFILTYISYFTFSYFFFNGLTLGQKCIGIKVTKEKNFSMKGLSFFDSLKRSIINYFCYKSFFSLFFLCLLQKDFKGLPDILSGTKTQLNTPVIVIEQNDYISKEAA